VHINDFLVWLDWRFDHRSMAMSQSAPLKVHTTYLPVRPLADTVSSKPFRWDGEREKACEDRKGNGMWKISVIYIVFILFRNICIKMIYFIGNYRKNIDFCFNVIKTIYYLLNTYVLLLINKIS